MENTRIHKKILNQLYVIVEIFNKNLKMKIKVQKTKMFVRRI